MLKSDISFTQNMLRFLTFQQHTFRSYLLKLIF